MEQDRKVIGLTANSQQLLNEILAQDWFSEAQDVARFCMAYAVKSGVKPASITGADTRWSISGFDQSGEIQQLINTLFPDNPGPVRTIEYFVNEGIARFHERVLVRGETPAELMV